jgi:hypothetical protein
VAAALRFDYGTFTGFVPDDIPAKDEPSLEAIAKNCVIGDAQHCAERIVEEIKRLTPFHYTCFMDCGAFDRAKVRRSMDRFAGEVMPLVHKALPNLAAIGGKPGSLRTGADFKLAAAQ